MMYGLAFSRKSERKIEVKEPGPVYRAMISKRDVPCGWLCPPGMRLISCVVRHFHLRHVFAPTLREVLSHHSSGVGYGG